MRACVRVCVGAAGAVRQRTLSSDRLSRRHSKSSATNNSTTNRRPTASTCSSNVAACTTRASTLDASSRSLLDAASLQYALCGPRRTRDTLQRAGAGDRRCRTHAGCPSHPGDSLGGTAGGVVLVKLGSDGGTDGATPRDPDVLQNCTLCRHIQTTYAAVAASCQSRTHNQHSDAGDDDDGVRGQGQGQGQGSFENGQFDRF